MIDNANPESYVGWAACFCELTPWMPPGTEREIVEVAGACFTVKRETYEKYGPFLEGTYCSDTAFHWRMARDGQPPLFTPALRVSHTNLTSFRELMKQKCFHRRCFAWVRVAEKGLSPAQRMLFAAGTPMLPALLFGRCIQRVFRNRVYRREFLLCAPVLLLGLICWSWGEFLGYLSAPGAPTERPRRALQSG
ncbi:MAG: hypothetical protein C4321_07000 [Chloroflexota bacterium]